MTSSSAKALAALTDVTPRVESFIRGSAAVFTCIAPDGREQNQDAVDLVARPNEEGVLIVCDGAGGLPGGQSASETVVRSIRESVQNWDLEIRSAVLSGIDEANAAIQKDGSGGGSTLAAVQVRENVIRTYHVGDSTILIVGQRGRIKAQTRDHSPTAYAVESGYLDEADAIHHEERHLVSNLVGCAPMSIEVGPRYTLAAYDTVVLGSDGLFDNVYLEEIAEIVRKGPIGRCAETLAALALQRILHPEAGNPSKLDDVTFIIYRQRRTRPKASA